MEVLDQEKLNSIKQQDNDNPIDKIYLYAKDINKPKYEYLIKKMWRCKKKTMKQSKSI